LIAQLDKKSPALTGPSLPSPTNLQRSFPINSLSHFFSSLEEGNGFLSDRDDNSSAGIAASPRSAELSRKRSETPQLHSISARQSFNDLVQYCVDDFLNIPLVKVRVPRRNALY
jgi:hypothetical protein